MKLRLRIAPSSGDPYVFEHEGTAVCIGRDPKCELQLTGEVNKAVSWRHARIELSARGASVIDLESSNGTFVNDQRIPVQAPLRVGDRVQLGQSGPTLEVLALDLERTASRPHEPHEPKDRPHGPDHPGPARTRQRSNGKALKSDVTSDGDRPDQARPASRQKMLLLGGGILGIGVLVALLGVYWPRGTPSGSIASTARPRPSPTVPPPLQEQAEVWVARQALPAGTQLADPEKLLQRRSVAKGQVPRNAVRGPEQFRGRSLNKAVTANQIVTEDDLRKSPTVSLQEERGWKAEGPVTSLLLTPDGRRSVSASTIVPAAVAIVHILLVMDTDDKEIGDQVKMDEKNLKSFFERSIAEKRRTITVLNGQQATKKEIDNYYRSLKVNANDTLLFYYSGHGATDESRYGHVLALNHDGFMERAKLLHEMRDKKPRLAVVLTDCCANRFKKIPDNRIARGDVVKENPVVQSLLFEHSGLVDVNGCSKGEFSVSDDRYGGFFTHVFMRECNQAPPAGGKASWGEFVPRVARGVHEMNDEQTPAAFSPLNQVKRAPDSIARYQEWDLAAARELRIFQPHEHEARCLALLPDGRRAVSGGKDQRLRLWDVATGKEHAALPLKEGVTCLAVVSQGPAILAGCGDGKIVRWDPTTGKVLQTLQHDSDTQTRKAVTSVAAAANDPKRAAYGAEDGTVALFDDTATHGRQLAHRHKGSVLHVSFSPDGTSLISASKDGQFRKWDVTTGAEIFPPFQAPGSLAGVASSPRGDLILFGGADGSIGVVDALTGQLLTTREHVHVDAVTSVVIAADGRRALTGGADGIIKLWKLVSE